MKITKKELSTIPNIISLIRLFCVPVFMFFVIYGGFAKESFVYIGLGIFLFASATDLLDGYLARKLNQVSELGKFLDPFSDKVMHMGVLLSLVIIGYVHWLFIVLILVKEMIMVLFGFALIKRDIVIQANLMGKIASAMLSAGVILAFFHRQFVDLGIYIDWIVLGIAVVLTYTAFVFYAVMAAKAYNTQKQEKLENTKEEERGTDNE